jgi:hypothetical protein
MKLYIADGGYVGTQAEAKQVDRAFRPVEVPTSKDELIAFLNQLVRHTADIYRSRVAIMPAPELFQSAPPATPAAIEASATRAAQIARDITIEEAIAEADYARALALAHHIHHRLMEHARAART